MIFWKSPHFTGFSEIRQTHSGFGVNSHFRYNVIMPFDPKKIRLFPQEPGVYVMKSRSGQVLYVGKAKNLKLRVKQYFSKSGDTRASIPYLVSKTESIDTILVHSEKEALLLESNLIKKYKPPYNVLFKDDKSYIALKMTTKHPWPRLEIVRYRGSPPADGLYFGPYTSAGAAREVYDLLNRLFPIRQCSDQEFARRTRPCILHQMGRCIAPCVDLCTKEEYQHSVQQVVRFLRGQSQEVVKELNKQMKEASASLEFEKAGRIRKTIEKIAKTQEKQNVDVPLGVNADVWAIYREGEDLVVSLLVIRGGRLSASKNYDFTKVTQDDEEMMEAFLVQYYEKREDLPKEIFLPFSLPNKLGFEEILPITLHIPKRGRKKELLEMAYLNAESAFKRERDESIQIQKILLQLQEKLHLSAYPTRIDCFDNSHLSGDELVSAMVVFTDGKPNKSLFRKYRISSTVFPDDYAAMREVLTRRYTRAKKENSLPDLVLIDGGKGHLNLACKVLQDLNISTVDVISIAKEKGRHDKGSTQEKIFLPRAKNPLSLRSNSSILFFLQRIRDEAHRFVLAFQKKRRQKKSLASSLEEIPGIGPVKRKRLLRHFGSVKRILSATKEDLEKVPGITQKDIQTLLAIKTD